MHEISTLRSLVFILLMTRIIDSEIPMTKRYSLTDNKTDTKYGAKTDGKIFVRCQSSVGYVAK